MIRKLINTILGDPNKKALQKIEPLVAQINKHYDEYLQTITDQNGVLAKTSEFKNRIKEGETVDQLLPEAFALVKIAATHLQGKSWEVAGKPVVWEMIPYNVQLIGGIVLNQGNIAEMKTGEGKTLVCTMPAYLNALTEKGVFIVTVNEYLATRDSEWMEGLYNYLGLSVGVIKNGMPPEAKQAAYNCDITYGTNNEFGFDFLRDNMATDKEKLVQRHLHYAIVDEVDSILIDEARTPLIISAPAAKSTEKYQTYSELVGKLTEKEDFEIDEKARQVRLTEDGIHKMEKLLGVDNIYTDAGFTEVHHIQQALRAQHCYKNSTDYIIQNGEIIIIDEFTGRLMAGRRYGQGLHQAIEAKEKVEVKRESKTLATVSFQNYFRLFEKLAGMTGTAKTEEEEFYQIYGLETIVIPTNKPVNRQDKIDLVFKNQSGKFSALVQEVKKIHEGGQPILIGTVSVEKSEILSDLLVKAGINHSVLNAKHHAKEAEIIADAGKRGAVTIATNMAGRGTDIKIDDEVKALGGLCVIGTERHEARRIDNQLRGRSGRQGDPGFSQFYTSMEDDLMRKFGADRIKRVMEMLNVPDDMPIQNGLIASSIESAQKKVEGHNFDIRKHLVEYDDVMNIHRNIIYKRRQEVLMKESVREEIETLFNEFAEMLQNLEPEKAQEKLALIFDNPPALDSNITEQLLAKHRQIADSIPQEASFHEIEKFVYLRTIDRLWMDHIDEMQSLRQVVAFSGYAQKDPLTEYKSAGFTMFQQLLAMIRDNAVITLLKFDPTRVVINKPAEPTTNPVIMKPSQAPLNPRREN